MYLWVYMCECMKAFQAKAKQKRDRNGALGNCKDRQYVEADVKGDA